MLIETKLNELRDRLTRTPISPGGKRTIDDGIKREIVSLVDKFNLRVQPTARSLGISPSALGKWLIQCRDQKPAKFNRVVVERAKSRLQDVEQKAATILFKTADGIEIHGLSVREVITVLREIRS